MASAFWGFLPLLAIFAAGLGFALFLAGGFCCGFIMLGRFLETLFRRLPWQPSLYIYSLGIISCVPAFLTTNAHGNSAAVLRITLLHFARALPSALAGWLETAVFGLPFLFAWMAWGLCRMENPVPKTAPTPQWPPPSETVWPPAPGEAVKTPAKPPEIKGRR